jgi:hypothetical protein
LTVTADFARNAFLSKAKRHTCCRETLLLSVYCEGQQHTVARGCNEFGIGREQRRCGKASGTILFSRAPDGPESVGAGCEGLRSTLPPARTPPIVTAVRLTDHGARRCNSREIAGKVRERGAVSPNTVGLI